MSIKALVDFWQQPLTADAHGRYIHPADESILQPWIAGAPHGKARVMCAKDAADLKTRSGQLHLCLPPMPYVGNLHSAKVIIAMINPTVSWQDYEDNRTAAFCQLRTQTLQQQVDKCFALESGSKDAPHRSWSGYYYELFNGFVSEYVTGLGGRQDLRDRLASETAILELVPYYSQNATMLTQGDLHKNLASAKCALHAMKEIAEREGTLIICRWASGLERWGLNGEDTEHKAKVVCSSSRRGLQRCAKEALAAHLEVRS